MKPYIVRKNVYKDFVMHEVFMNGSVSYCYYENIGNSFVNKVYFVIGSFCYVGSLLENSLYVFCSDISKLREVVSILYQEYSNLGYVFVLFDGNDKMSIQNFLVNSRLQAEVIFLEEYLKRREDMIKEKDGVKNITYGLDKGGYSEIQKEELKNWNVDKNFADYNGFNESLIDRNVKNIVQIKKGNGGKNEL